MKKALEESKKGIGFVNPNPLVGAVIVKDNELISKGYHEFFGGNHAEINALKNAKKSVLDSTMYVTLEPCCHYGKTPPCTEAIIKSGIKKVVVGLKDPNPLVAGKGIQQLIDNNIEVELYFMKEIEKVNEIFLHNVKYNRPFILLKNAMSLDGKIATYTGESKWISSQKSREYVHHLRNKYMSIMVGINTVIKDNPKLNVRLDNKKTKNPIPIILDSFLKIPMESNLIKNKELIIATSKECNKDKKIKLENKGIKVIVCPKQNKKINLKYLVNKLKELGIDSILVEGGATLNESFLKSSLTDKYMTFIAPKLIGGVDALTPIGGKGFKSMSEVVTLEELSYEKIGSDFLITGYFKKE